MSIRGKVLVVLLDGQRIGRIVEESGQFSFSYDENFRTDRHATPLSLSLPLSSPRHGDPAVRAFLWGLLPDNERVVDRWAREYQVSPGNPFALLRYVGADCAGAVQFAPPDEAVGLLTGAGGVDWLEEAEIGRRLRTLRRDPTAWHLSESGQFSLAGAQAKTALHFDPGTGRWGEPWGATPTTHIIKPAITGFDDHDLNEHICLRAAALLNLNAVSSAVVAFDGERAVVVERYDRVRRPDGILRRIHQEDMCQALGVPPTRKYQNEGGPSPEDILVLLQERTNARVQFREVRGFLDALAFNWIVAGTDAHAKNYSILLNGVQVRLAPMYDVASALPYDDMYLPKLKLAMRIGSEYVISKIGGRHWRELANRTGLDPDQTVERVDEIAAGIADAFAQATKADPVRALRSDLPERLLDRIAARARSCRAALARN